jgi:hypothetical protein
MVKLKIFATEGTPTKSLFGHYSNFNDVTILKYYHKETLTPREVEGVNLIFFSDDV